MAKFVWPSSTMGGTKRTLENLKEHSENAKAHPGLDPKDNFGVKGELTRFLQLLTRFYNYLHALAITYTLLQLLLSEQK